MNKSILSKIQKLSLKAESAKELGNLAESIAFSSKVSEMLTLHNLKMSDINTEDETDVDGFESDDLGLTSTNGRWTINLLSVLCSHNYCSPIYTKINQKNDYKVTIVGQPENVEVVKYLYSVLKVQFERISKQEWKKYLTKTREEIGNKFNDLDKEHISKPWKYFNGVSTRFKYITSFFKGAVSGVRTKLNDQRREAEQKYGNKITDMVVVKDADVKEYISKEFPNLGTFRSRRSTINREAYESGVKVGSNASMAKGVANNESVATTMLS